MTETSGNFFSGAFGSDDDNNADATGSNGVGVAKIRESLARLTVVREETGREHPGPGPWTDDGGPVIDPGAWVNDWALRGADGKINEKLTKDSLPYTDLACARKLRSCMPVHLRFSGETGRWRAWDGSFYKDVSNGWVQGIVSEVGMFYLQILEELEKEYDDRADIAHALEMTRTGDVSAANKKAAAIRREFTNEWTRWIAYSRHLGNGSACVGLQKKMEVEHKFSEKQWDLDDGIIAFDGGYVTTTELSTGVDGSASTPSLMVTKAAACEWLPGKAPGVLWETYITTTVPDPELRRYLQKAAGYALLGNPNKKVIFNLIGPSNSGKSVFINMVNDTVGDYSKVVASSTFLKKRMTGGSDFDRAQLRGARFVFASEPAAGSFFDDNLMKSISGRDLQNTQEKYEKNIAWVPRCTIFIASNQSVRFDTTDEAFLGRIKPIPFRVRFLDGDALEDARTKGLVAMGLVGERDDDIEAKIRAEGLEQVLDWLLEGARMFLIEGLIDPSAVKSAVTSMETEVELPFQWADEMIEEGWLRVLTEVERGSEPTSTRALIGSLYKAYCAWEKEALGKSSSTVAKKRFSQLMQKRYGELIRSNGMRLPELSIDMTKVPIEVQLLMS